MVNGDAGRAGIGQGDSVSAVRAESNIPEAGAGGVNPQVPLNRDMSPGKPDAGAAGIGQRDCLSFVSTRRDVTEVQRTLTGCQLDLRAGARGRAARIAQASHQNYCKSKVYPLRTNRFLRKAAESRFSQAADKLRLHVLPPGRPAK